MIKKKAHKIHQSNSKLSADVVLTEPFLHPIQIHKLLDIPIRHPLHLLLPLSGTTALSTRRRLRPHRRRNLHTRLIRHRMSRRKGVLLRRPVQALADLCPRGNRPPKRLEPVRVAGSRFPRGAVGVAAAVDPVADVRDLAAADVLVEGGGAVQDGQQDARLVPAALDLGDGDAEARLEELPEGEGPLGGDGDAVAEAEVLAQPERQVRVLGRFLAVGVRDRGVAVDVAGEVDAGRGDAGGVLLELLDDLVDDHDVVAVADAEADRFADPELLAAEEEAVVGALARRGGVVAQGVDEGEAVVDHLRGVDAAVHLGVADAVAAFDDVFPIDAFVIMIGYR